MFPRLASRRLCFVIFLALGVCFVPFFDMTFNILVPPCNSTLSKLPARAAEGEGDGPGEGAEAGSHLAGFSLTCDGTSQAALHPGGPTLASARAPRLRSAGEAGAKRIGL